MARASTCELWFALKRSPFVFHWGHCFSPFLGERQQLRDLTTCFMRKLFVIRNYPWWLNKPGWRSGTRWCSVGSFGAPTLSRTRRLVWSETNFDMSRLKEKWKRGCSGSAGGWFLAVTLTLFKILSNKSTEENFWIHDQNSTMIAFVK